MLGRTIWNDSAQLFLIHKKGSFSLTQIPLIGRQWINVTCESDLFGGKAKLRSLKIAFETTSLILLYDTCFFP